jgi:hydrophobic/amphiphilic exporter-1 (mainly G- bacteria), HAE1 family
LPIVFVQEEAGQLFRDIALAITAAVSLSLVVSMIVIPPAAARLFGRRREEREDAEQPAWAARAGSANGDHTWEGNGDAENQPAPTPPTRRHRLRALVHGGSRSAVGALEKFGSGFGSGVVGVNRFIQGSVLRGLAVVGSLVAAAILLSYVFWPKVEYLPTGNRNLVFGILLPPPGYNLDKLMEIGEQVERDLRPYWDIDPNSPEAQQLDFPVIGDFFFVARGRQVFLGIRAHEPSRVGELIPLVQRVGSRLPGTFTVAKQSSLFEQGLTGGRTIEVEIVGPELTQLVSLGGQVMGQVRETVPGAQVRPVPSLDLNSPELHIKPKLVQAAQMGVNSTELGYAANALVDGAYAGDYFLGGDKIDLTIMGAPLDGSGVHRGRSQEIRALPIATPIGELVPLEAVADVELSSGPEQINHRERVRAITIEVSPPPEVALEDAMDRIQSQIVLPMLSGGQLEGGYRINLAGTADKLATMQQTFVGDLPEWIRSPFMFFGTFIRTGEIERPEVWSFDSFIRTFTSQFVLVILITYLLMAALFESWLYPLVIIFSVPLGAVGGILGLNLLNVYLGLWGRFPSSLTC